MLRAIFLYLILVFLSVTPAVFAAGETTPKAGARVENDDASRAQELLSRAVEYYGEHKDRALAAFSRAGEFINGELYVYVIGTDGQMLASGGTSSVLIGRDVSGMSDATGKLFLREMIDTALSKGAGQVEYRWLNRADYKVEPKVAYYQKVDDRIIAVGFYVPRASQEQAKALLAQAVNAVRKKPLSAFSEFNDLDGRFIQDDLYVFVFDLEDIIFHAHGVMPRLVGTDALDLKDPTGKPIIREMLEIARGKGQGSLTYQWRNPVTEKIETKHTFLHKVNNYVVAVGHYTR